MRLQKTVIPPRQTTDPIVDVVVGGQYGSEGKGRVSAAVASEYDVLTRVGGPNAGHTVVREDGRTYICRHVPSGWATSNAKLIIGPAAIIDADILMREIEEFDLRPDRLAVDESAILIEPSDAAADMGLFTRIGTTGTGVSSASLRRITGRDGRTTLRRVSDDPRLARFAVDTVSLVDSLRVDRPGLKILLEGTQGFKLSIIHGAYPYVTSNDTTVGTLLAGAGLPWNWVRRVTVVCRRFPIRSGGSTGPMGEETSWRAVEDDGGHRVDALSCKEVGSVSGRARRVAAFDFNGVRRAVRVNGATDIALTCMDHAAAADRGVSSLDGLSTAGQEFIRNVRRSPVARSLLSRLVLASKIL